MLTVFELASTNLTPYNEEYATTVKSGLGLPFHVNLTVIVNFVPAT